MADFATETDRLILRSWRRSDVGPFYAMCSDERIMATLGPLMSLEETRNLIRRVDSIEREFGHTFWALERKSDARFIGWCGLTVGTVGPIEGKIEIGWRIAHHGWGQGYAREAAQASLDWGFEALSVDRIWAITTAVNTRSWGLMKRLGMVRHADLDFTHPKVPDGSELKPHITYSIARDDWRKGR